MSDSGRTLGDKEQKLHSYYLSGLPVPEILQEIVRIHSQKADDRCWMDLDALFKLCGLPPVDKRVGDKFAMIKNCVRFVEQQCEQGGPWKSYAELEDAYKDAQRIVEEQQEQLQILKCANDHMTRDSKEQSAYVKELRLKIEATEDCNASQTRLIIALNKEVADRKDSEARLLSMWRDDVAASKLIKYQEQTIDSLSKQLRRYQDALQKIVTQSSDYSDRLTAQKALEGQEAET